MLELMKPTRRPSVSLVTETARAVLMNVQSLHKWWSTLKSAVFGSSSAVLPLVSKGGGQVCDLVVKADLLSDHFDSRHGRQLICRSLAIRLIVLRLSPSCRERSGVSCQTWTLMVALTHWVFFIFF